MNWRRTTLAALGAAGCILSVVAPATWVQAQTPTPTSPTRQADPRTDTGPIIRPAVQVGDEWTYRRAAGAASGMVRQSVVKVDEQGISLRTETAGSLDSSIAVHDLAWGVLGSGFNTYRPALAYYAFPLYSGRRWGIDSTVSNFGAGQEGRMKGEGRAVGWEEVAVPAGRFMAMRIELDIETVDPGEVTRKLSVRETHWYARTVLRPVKVVTEINVAGEQPRSETVELLDYRIE